MIQNFRLRALLLSVLLLVPCLWQRRIQAVDLPSHVYNSWLAQQIELGKAPGLEIAPVKTNMLFDVGIAWLFKTFGAEPAQRIAVSLTVLLFFWGGFALISRISGQRRWFLIPCLMMLSYSWVFYMGFSNFYLACGMAIWAVVLGLRREIKRDVAAALLLAVAYFAHALPVFWAIAVIVYTRIADMLPFRARVAVFAASAVGVFGAKEWISHRYHSSSTFHQVLEASGVDQVWVFGFKYIAISIGLGMLWGFLLLRLSHVKGFRDMVGDAYFQICALTALAILLIPSHIELPGYRAALSFVTERMSLLHGIVICAYLGASDPPRWMRIAFLPLAALYFSFVYADTSAINRVERKMEILTSGLTLEDRVISSFEDPTARVQLWGHNIDRACLGKCLSYANYEPASLAFRVQARKPNPLVVVNIEDGAGMQDGGYRVKESDLPFYQVTLCGSDLCLRKLNPGDVTKHDVLIATPLLW